MAIVRKTFSYPQSKWIEVEAYKGFWGDKKVIEKRAVDMTLEEVLQQVHDFVATIGEGNIINICEFTTAKYRIGDDGNHWFVIWYKVPEVAKMKPCLNCGAMSESLFCSKSCSMNHQRKEKLKEEENKPV